MTKFKQRDVVKVRQELPSGEVLIHPFLIISCNLANSRESFYSAVMMTSTSYKDQFSFPLDNSMFERPLEKPGCQFRLYILSSFRESNVLALLTTMRKLDFKAVLTQIKDFTLSIDQ